MNLPQNVFLRTVGGEVKLCVLPVKETELLYTAQERFTDVSISQKQAFKHLVSSKCCDITLSVPIQSSFALTLFGFDLSYDSEQSILKCIDKEAPVRGENGFLTVRLIMDTINTEVFADCGSIFMGMTYMQDHNLNTLAITSESAIDKIDLHIAELNPFWENAKR